MRNWTRALYWTERKLRLWEYMPFTDLADASALIRYVQAQTDWVALVPNAPIPIAVQKAKAWEETGGVHREGIRKLRGKLEYVITYPMGCVSFGFTIHELAHVPPPWPPRDEHPDRYMRIYLALYKEHSPRAYLDVILEELRGRGMPVEEFL